MNKVVVYRFAITDRGYPFDTPWRKILVDAFQKCVKGSGLTAKDMQCGSVGYNERTISEAALGTRWPTRSGFR
ncbi:MAG: hypothetical protein MZU97_12695 [Bacillus subtilis]|nr:hypothetical protein [Bacillus subtilis]